MAGIISGAISGGLAGSVVPGVGTVVGAVIGGAIGGITEAIDLLKNALNTLKSSILETVAVFRPVAVLQFTRAVKDLQAVFGDMLLPVLDKATGFIRQLADYIYGMPSSIGRIIRALAEGTVIAGGITAIGVALAGLAIFVAPIGALGAALKYLYERFSETIGGATAIERAINLFERGISALSGIFEAAWARTANVRSELSKALDELGNSMSELFHALEPLLAAAGGVMIRILAGAIRLAVMALTGLVEMITQFQRALTDLISPLSELLRMAGIQLPKSQQQKASAFGLGWAGAQVSDPLAVYNRLTEEIMRGSRGGKKPEQATADNTAIMAQNTTKMEGYLKSIYEYVINYEKRAAGAAIGSLPSMQLVNR